MFNWRIIQK